MLRQDADANVPRRNADGEGENDRRLTTFRRHQNPTAQSGTVCQIKSRLIHFTAHRCDSVFKNARTLSPTDHLWSITARYYNEVALHKKTSLREFIYIAMIVRNEDVDWDRFLELTHEFGTYAACYYPLAFLHSIEPSRVPEAALSKLRPVEGRRGRDYGWQLGKLFDFIEPLPFRPEAQEFPSQ